MRRAMITGLMGSILAVSGCATPPPTQTGTVGSVTSSAPTAEEKQAAFERLQREQQRKREMVAEEVKNFEAMRAEKTKDEAEVTAKREAELATWIQANRSYLLKLCHTAPGSDHADAWENFHIAVSSDTQRVTEASGTHKRVIDCDKLIKEVAPNPQMSGYTWSNGRRYISGFICSNVIEVRS